MAAKMRVGLFSFASCEGCFMELLNLYAKNMVEWNRHVEFAYARVLKEHNDMNNLDLALVEGAICTPHDVEKLREIRKNSKKLVTFGMCAVQGWPSNQRNKFTDEMKRKLMPRIEELGQFARVYQPGELVRVDEAVPGCPIDIHKFEGTLERYLKEFKIV